MKQWRQGKDGMSAQNVIVSNRHQDMGWQNTRRVRDGRLIVVQQTLLFQKEVKMKYISMKMDPNGSRPPMRAMTDGRRYHFLCGMGEGMRFTRQGLSGLCKQKSAP